MNAATTTTTTTPIERIALSMLDAAEAWQPELRAWVSSIREDVTAAADFDAEIARALIAHDTGLIPERHDTPANRMRQEATYRLAAAIADYRRDGRPEARRDGDRVRRGTHSPDLSEHVVAYHTQMLNAYAVECEALEDAR